MPAARSARFVLAAALFAAGLAVYLPALENGFINMDDGTYLTRNPWVQRGPTADGVRWALTTGHAANWHPLTWISHMVDWGLFGERAWGHHLHSALLHALNGVLLFLVLARASGQTGPSAFTAAVFALHPLHVESVAWAAERKDVLSTCLGLAALAAWVRHVERPSPGRHAAAAVCLALGLAAKPMLVTLPFVMLLLDLWPLGRLGRATSTGRTARREPWTWALIREKLPFLALAAASALATFLVQRGGGAVTAVEAMPPGMRVRNALVAYLRYLGKAFWPSDLAIFYPHPGETLGNGEALLALLALAAITAAVLRLARRWPWLAVGWFLYAGMLVPVIGLVQVGSQAMADRYMYLPLVGLTIPVAWGGSLVAARGPRSRRAVACGAAGVLAALAWLTVAQVGTWRDSETVFRRAVEVTRENYTAHNNLGIALEERGAADEAARHYRLSLEARPTYHNALNNLALVEARSGRHAEAEALLRRAMACAPLDPTAWCNLGYVLAQQGRGAEAVEEYRRAIALDPDYAEALNNLGHALAGLGRDEEALPHYRRALALRPGYEKARNNLGAALYRLGVEAALAGRPERAEAWLAEAVALRPRHAESRNNLGNVLAGAGRVTEALPHFEEAVRLAPSVAAFHVNLAKALLAAGRRDEAAARLRHVLETLDPANAEARRLLQGAGGGG
ncbi:MAG: tetratricopeptide repeat protein [Planctomycetes bacterium]|nr:tetratricopeptide repeat protein [Planctomycetota bacterium]